MPAASRPNISSPGYSSAVSSFVHALDAYGVDAGPDGFELSRAMIDVDGMLTDDELMAFAHVFVAEHHELSKLTPADLRRRKVFRRSRTFLHQPSPLFSSLVDADAGDGGHRSATYLAEALQLLRAVASLDAHVSHVEVDAIEKFRQMLVAAMSAAGVVTELPEHDVDRDAGSLPELLGKLDDLIGLEPVKQRVHQLTDLLRVLQLRRERGLTVPVITHHLAFVGNPGTGKTTVARLIGEIYRELGVLEKGHLVEVDRADLVAGYVGQTATRVDDVMAQALDGVLLIDEAYGLVRGTDGYGAEAVDALVKRMEDHRDRVVIILTGYPHEMESLLDSNPGLRSRIARVIEFPDYTSDELVKIFELIAARSGYEIDHELRGRVAEWFGDQPRDRQFGNGRAARQLFEDAMIGHAGRVSRLDDPSDNDLTRLVETDLPQLHNWR